MVTWSPTMSAAVATLQLQFKTTTMAILLQGILVGEQAMHAAPLLRVSLAQSSKMETIETTPAQSKMCSNQQLPPILCQYLRTNPPIHRLIPRGQDGKKMQGKTDGAVRSNTNLIEIYRAMCLTTGSPLYCGESNLPSTIIHNRPSMISYERSRITLDHTVKI